MKVLFQNPKAALAYVGLTMAGVVLFIGTEDDPGSLQQTVDTFGGGRSASDVAASRKFDKVDIDDRVVFDECVVDLVVSVNW